MSKTVKFKFPYKGQVQGMGYTSQPEGTSPVCSNVVPFDPQTDRMRGSQRMGTNNWNSSAIGGGAAVVRMHQATSTAGVSKIAAVSSGNVYVGTTPTTLPLATSGSGVLGYTSGQVCHSCDLFGSIYFTDENTAAPKILNLATNTVSTLAASTGSLPGAPKVCCNFRGRLVLANVSGTPQGVFMSRAGTPTDWDYSQQDALAAVSLNASNAGKIGEPVTALVPGTADQLVIGCTSSVYILKGDPMDGGIILNVSDSVGMPWKDGYDMDPSGNLYFLGTGGFYRMDRGGGELVNLSKGRMDAFFATIKTTDAVNVVWDRDRKGAWIFAVAIAVGAGATRLACWYDARTDGFFPALFPSNHGPLHAGIYDGVTTTERLIMMGGRDGIIRRMQPDYEMDDNTTIDTSVYFGPFRLNESGVAIITETEFFFGNNDPTYASTFEARWRISAAKDATEVVGNALRNMADQHTTQGRQIPNRKRLMGDWFTLEVYNTTNNRFWAFEEMLITFEDHGRRR